MAEYIERNRLVKHYENCIDEVKNTNGITEDFEICLKALKNQPAADVAEVRRGKWEFINQSTNYLEPPIGDMCKCSECNFKIDVSETLFKFCPNCGAKMDLGDDEK